FEICCNWSPQTRQVVSGKTHAALREAMHEGPNAIPFMLILEQRPAQVRVPDNDHLVFTQASRLPAGIGVEPSRLHKRQEYLALDQLLQAGATKKGEVYRHDYPNAANAASASASFSRARAMAFLAGSNWGRPIASADHVSNDGLPSCLIVET